MACSYKRTSDVELLKLYRNNDDLTAYKVLLDKYKWYSRNLAGEIVSSFRQTFLPDYNELVLIGIFCFEIATKLFDLEKKYFNSYWKKIAKQKMIEEVYRELDEYSYVSRNVIYEERCGPSRPEFALSGFASSIEGADDLLMEDIISFLDDPKNMINPIDKMLFLDYLETPNFAEVAKKHNRCTKSARIRINRVRYRIIKELLGEDI